MVCRFGLGACCPTCPNICKEFAREEQTFTNTTIDLDCNDFDDPTCYFDDCPSKCAASFSRGERNEACEQYEDRYPDCFLPCPQQCRDSYDNGETRDHFNQAKTISICFDQTITACNINRRAQ